MDTASGINAASSAIQSATNAYVQTAGKKKWMKKAHQYNQEMASQAHQWDLDSWNRQNAYNTPEAQKQRLKDAGINPHEKFGGGTASIGASGIAPYQKVSDTSTPPQPLPRMNMLSDYQDIQMKKAQVDSIKAGTSLQQEQAGMAEIEKNIKMLTGKQLGLDLQVNENYQSDAAAIKNQQNRNQIHDNLMERKFKEGTPFKGGQSQHYQNRRLREENAGKQDWEQVLGKLIDDLVGSQIRAKYQKLKKWVK